MQPGKLLALDALVYEEVVRAGVPVANTRRLLVDGRSYRYDGLMLPLSTDGVVIDALLVGVVPYDIGSAGS